MGPERWRRFIKPCWERIYAEVHRQGKKSIQHSCGSIAEIYGDLAEIGMDCHESVQPEAYGMKPDILHKKWGKTVSFWGCLGSQSTLHDGSPHEIRTEIKRLAELFKKDGGFVLAPAKPLVDEMPIDKAVAVVEALAELNGY
jgi:uroporphyrinogen decarboxylase